LNRCIDAVIETGDAIRDRLMLGTDNDAVRAQEIGNSGAFAEELGVGCHVYVRSVEPGRELAVGPDRHS